MPKQETPVYRGILDLIFCGDRVPGSKLIEEHLASELGVSRVPVRESLARLVGQGVLVGGKRGEGVRIRDYSADDVRQLYEYREVLEGVSARAAAQMASPTDIARLEIICQQAAECLHGHDHERWNELEQQFHFALADASHNRRVAPQLKLLVQECRYIFFGYASPPADSEKSLRFLEKNRRGHIALVDLIKARDADGAEQLIRTDMRESAGRVVHLMLTGEFTFDK